MDTLRDKNHARRAVGSRARRRGRSGERRRRSPATFWRGKRVLVTGHTGFKGGWLALWLHRLGAEVTGLALAPRHEPEPVRPAPACDAVVDSRIVDIRDARRVAARGRARAAGDRASPGRAGAGARELSRPARHLRHQRDGHGASAGRAARPRRRARRVVVVTTDKVYRNRETGVALPRERSRSAATIPTAPARRRPNRRRRATATLFLQAQGVGRRHRARRQCHRRRRLVGGPADPRRGARLAAPASRWSCAGPRRSRPWQHVLEPLAGYLLLARALVATARARRRLQLRPATRRGGHGGEVVATGARGLSARATGCAATARERPARSGLAGARQSPRRATRSAGAALGSARSGASARCAGTARLADGAGARRARLTSPTASRLRRRYRGAARHEPLRRRRPRRSPGLKRVQRAAAGATSAASSRACSAPTSWPRPAGASRSRRSTTR